VVTDDAVLADPAFPTRARGVLEAGGAALALHLRGPGTPGGPIFELARDLVPAADAAGALVVVNDRVDVALLAGAAAVQLGARSLPVRRARPLLPAGTGIGVSTHAAGEVAAAEEDEADWAFVGTIYPTPSHPGRPGGGLELVRRAAGARRRLPLVAIGGVTPERVGPVVGAGATGVAVLGGIWGDPDPPGAVDRYRSALAEQEER
jgi:thiamine-phosphate diphosphorylase